MRDLDDIASMLESLPAVIETWLTPVPSSVLATRHVPGEWCAHEVIGHLLACDTAAFEDRVTAILDGDRVIPGFRPWDAINARDFRSCSLTELVGELRVSRKRAGAFVRALAGRDLTVTGSLIDDDRAFAAADFVYEWPYHDQEHLAQIAGCVQHGSLPHMTETMRGALGR